MLQNNNQFYQDEQSKKMLARFEEISTKENIEDIKPLSTSIQFKCKCGCMHVWHFALPSNPEHYQEHFVELCDKHKLSQKELEV